MSIIRVGMVNKNALLFHRTTVDLLKGENGQNPSIWTRGLQQGPLPTQTMHYYRVNPWKSPKITTYICILWSWIPHPPQKTWDNLTSWWLNQPIWKICSSNWIISAKIGVKIPKMFGSFTTQLMTPVQGELLLSRFSVGVGCAHLGSHESPQPILLVESL